LCVAILLQSIVLPCLCYAGTLKLSVALMVDALVLARVVLAKARHERGRGWVFYAALPFLVVPVLLIAFGH
jgi:hypothetical protein